VFDLRRPCVNCPFRRGQGELFQLGPERLYEIVTATAFQCHKTVDYSDWSEAKPGDRPQQCAGLMTLLHRERLDNQIMQVAQILGVWDPVGMDPKYEVYDTLAECLEAHGR
jgi:hypothetical protein